MKLKILFFLSFLGIFFLTCCGGNKGTGSPLKSWMQESGEKRILCTTAQVGDIVQAIGGDRIKNLVLIQGDLDPHSYELVKGDGEKIQAADLIFYNGLNLEHGVSLSELLRSSEKSIAIGDMIASNHPEVILQKDTVVDPHLWMDISSWALSCQPISDALTHLDPDGAIYYQERAKALSSKMAKAHLSIKETLAKVPPTKRYLLTSHDAFRYFTRAYLAVDGETSWEERFAAPEGLAPDGQLSSLDIQRMIVFVRQYRTSVLFPESNVSPDSIRKIALAGKELGLDISVCSEALYGDSMSGLSYFEMMEKNAEILARYLTK